MIKLDDLNIDDEGVKIKYDQRDFRRDGKVYSTSPKDFVVPFHKSNPEVCPASHIINYMDVMQKNLKDLRPSDRYEECKLTHQLVDEFLLHNFHKSMRTGMTQTHYPT